MQKISAFCRIIFNKSSKTDIIYPNKSSIVIGTEDNSEYISNQMPAPYALHLLIINCQNTCIEVRKCVSLLRIFIENPQ